MGGGRMGDWEEGREEREGGRTDGRMGGKEVAG